MRLDCFEKSLRRFFGVYGRFLAQHAVLFIIIPLSIVASLGVGVQYIYTEYDSEFLYTPTNGRAKEEKRIVEALFANRTCEGAPLSRRTCDVESARLIALSKNTGGILQRAPFEEILNIYYQIKNITISQGDENFTFDDLCVKWKGSCQTVNLFALYDFDSDNINNLNVTYPFSTGNDGETYFLGSELGGVKRNGLIVEEARAIQLSFTLQERMDGLSKDWLDIFLEECKELESESLEIYVYTSEAISQELSKSSRDVIGHFSIAFGLLISFSVLSCFRFDCVLNKPALAVAGVLSACLAILSAFGLIGLCGVPYIDISSSTPYFIISIGVDDMFIMMAAWRKTNPRLPVDVRTGETLSEAALSITITSFTDLLVFIVGAFSPFPSVSYFSLLTGAAVIFDYLYQITFFSACMAISGRREKASRHSIICIKVKPPEESTNCCYACICSGSVASNNVEANNDAYNNAESNNVATNNDGYNNVESSNVASNNDASTNPASNNIVSNNVASNNVELTNVVSDTVASDSPHPLMTFFRDYFSVFICKPRVKAIILAIYFSYIACAIWGVTCLKEGLSYRDMLPKDSFVTKYLDAENVFFKEFGFPVSVVVSGNIEFSNPAYQEDLNQELAKFEDNEFTLPAEYSQSWLRSFQLFIINNVSQHEDAVDVLKYDFLQHPDYADYWYDLVFDDTGEHVVASRFYVSTTNLKHTTDEKDMMVTFRNLADSSPYNITVFSPAFIFFDQYLKVVPTTLRSLGIAFLAMLVVAIMLIPIPLCAVWVALTILSIELGMIGFMALWGVHIDPVSMIVIIVCIGFSVDFPAHITYVFAISEATTADDRVQDALYSLGMPVLQGAGSSILGVLVISSSDVYIFSAFFKTMFLVISLGALHALFFLPVLLSLFSRTNPKISISDETLSGRRNPVFEPHRGGDETVDTHEKRSI